MNLAYHKKLLKLMLSEPYEKQILTSFQHCKQLKMNLSQKMEFCTVIINK